MMSGLCFAEKYELSKDQQQYILQKLSNADIKGAEALMLLQAAQALQKPIVEEPKKDLTITATPIPTEKK
jgi:hypothetical protein